MIGAHPGPPAALSSLLRVELQRAFARRMVRVMAIVVVAGIVLTGVITAAKSHPEDSTEVERRINTFVEACTNSSETFGSKSFDAQGQPIPTQEPAPASAERRERCRQVALNSRAGSSQGLRISDLNGILGGTTAPLALIGLMFGASLIAAEWRAGSIATQLTWEPRRLRVIASKLFAAVVLSVTFFVVMQALLSGVLWLVAATRGSTAGAGMSLMRAIVARQGRALVLVGFATMFGFGVGSIGKNTAAALGAIAGYMIIGEQVLAGLVRWIRPWLISVNSIVFVAGGIEDDFVHRSAFQAFATLLLYCGGAAVVAITLFRQRDVIS